MNGKRSTREITKKTKRQITKGLNDLARMKAMDIIEPKKDSHDEPIIKDNSVLYTKNPLIEFLSQSFILSIHSPKENYMLGNLVLPRVALDLRE